MEGKRDATESLLKSGSGGYEVEENRDSPECLLTSGPVKDPYSTDEEKERGIKADFEPAPGFYTDITYNSSNVTLETLQKYFNLKFHSLPNKPAFEHKIQQEQNFSEILHEILCFAANKKSPDVDVESIIEEVLKLPDRGLNVLYGDKDFHINFKESAAIPTCTKTSPLRYMIACNYMNKMVDVLLAAFETTMVDSEQHHAIVKSCMSSFCSLTSGLVIDNAACETVLHSTFTSKISGSSETESFKARPDLVLKYSVGSEPFPGIPIEVYSPGKKMVIEKRSKPATDGSHVIKDSDLSTSNKKFLIDEKSKNPLSEFINSNIPVYKYEVSHEWENSYKNKLIAQHLLQILGTASQYCYYKLHIKGGLMQKSKVFLGLLVCDEYVYITKVQGDEACFAKYKSDPVFDLASRSVTDKLKLLASGHPDPRIDVQFSSIVLDLSVHSHRMALLFFLQFWMSNWDDVKADFIT